MSQQLFAKCSNIPIRVYKHALHGFFSLFKSMYLHTGRKTDTEARNGCKGDQNLIQYVSEKAYATQTTNKFCSEK
jgi:hypothetical protein